MNLVNKIVNIINAIILFLITYLPGKYGFLFRRLYWKNKLLYLGKHTRIDVGVYFQNPEYIFIDKNTWIDRNVIILAGLDKSNRDRIKVNNKDYPGDPGVVYIGKNVHIAPNVIISGISSGVYISDNCAVAASSKIYSFSHHYRSSKKDFVHWGPMMAEKHQIIYEGPVFLGENTGVALNSIILPGVYIGKNSFVNINSVLKKRYFKENSLIDGNPAKRIGDRF